MAPGDYESGFGKHSRSNSGDIDPEETTYMPHYRRSSATQAYQRDPTRRRSAGGTRLFETGLLDEGRRRPHAEERVALPDSDYRPNQPERHMSEAQDGREAYSYPQPHPQSVRFAEPDDSFVNSQPQPPSLRFADPTDSFLQSQHRRHHVPGPRSGEVYCVSAATSAAAGPAAISVVSGGFGHGDNVHAIPLQGGAEQSWIFEKQASSGSQSQLIYTLRNAASHAYLGVTGNRERQQGLRLSTTAQPTEFAFESVRHDGRDAFVVRLHRQGYKRRSGMSFRPAADDVDDDDDQQDWVLAIRPAGDGSYDKLVFEKYTRASHQFWTVASPPPFAARASRPPSRVSFQTSPRTTGRTSKISSTSYAYASNSAPSASSTQAFTIFFLSFVSFFWCLVAIASIGRALQKGALLLVGGAQTSAGSVQSLIFLVLKYYTGWGVWSEGVKAAAVQIFYRVLGFR